MKEFFNYEAFNAEITEMKKISRMLIKVLQRAAVTASKPAGLACWWQLIRGGFAQRTGFKPAMHPEILFRGAQNFIFNFFIDVPCCRLLVT